MRRPVKETDVIWDTIELPVPGAQLTVWSRKDETTMPSINAEKCINYLAPEHTVTKQFWINKFEAIKQRCDQSYIS